MTGHQVSPVEHDWTRSSGHEISRLEPYWKRPDAGVLRPVELTGASGHPVLCPVKGYNGSISWGLLFKPHGRLKHTLLAILH